MTTNTEDNLRLENNALTKANADLIKQLDNAYVQISRIETTIARLQAKVK